MFAIHILFEEMLVNQTRTTFPICAFRHLVAMTELQRKQHILIPLLLIRISN